MIGAASRDTTTREARGLLLELHGQAQHALLLGSLLVLALTGLPQKFDSLALSRWFMDSAGGIETLRLIHHIAGGVLIFAGLYHFALVLVAILVLKVLAPLQMIPDARDFREALQTIRYFLGLRQESVPFDRPSYFQKLDYWVIAWGMALMGASGMALLFPVRAARLISGDVVLATLRVHSDSAILIVAWVLIVHLIYAGLSPALFHDRSGILSGRAHIAGLPVPPTPRPASDAAPPAADRHDPDREVSGQGMVPSLGVSRRQEEEPPGDTELGR